MWAKRYGASSYDELLTANIVSDGGVIAAGTTYSTTGDAWLLKLDAAGTVQWSKTVGNPLGDDLFREARELPDGSFIVGGQLVTLKGENAWAAKFSAAGAVQWSKQYGNSVPGNLRGSSDRIYRILPTPDGGFIFTGWTSSFFSTPTLSRSRAWVGKLDSAGKILWVKSYPAPAGAQPDTMADFLMPTADGNYLVVGINWEFNNGDWTTGNGFIFKIDPNGQQLWRRWWNGSAGLEDRSWGAVETVEGDYLVPGFTTAPDGSKDITLMRFSPAGDLLSSTQYGSPGTDELLAGLSPIACSPTKAYIVGYSLLSPTVSDPLLLEIDLADPMTFNQYAYGQPPSGSKLSQLDSVRYLDGKLLIAGHAGSDGLVMMLDNPYDGACYSPTHHAQPGPEVQSPTDVATEPIAGVGTVTAPSNFVNGPGYNGGLVCAS